MKLTLICIKDVVMDGTGMVEFTAGKTYQARMVIESRDNSGDSHLLALDFAAEHFYVSEEAKG